MKCFFCKGDMIQSTTKFIVDLGACVVIVKNVPAEVCTQCGETSFDNEVAAKLEQIVNQIKNSFITEIAIVEYTQGAA